MATEYNLPLVTVICTCYNHGDYVQESLQSVINQTYNNVQLIVVDNASEDNSLINIRAFQKSFPAIQIIENSVNLGICKAFNKAVSYAKGKYLIDLAADDVLLPDKISLHVEAFEKLDSSYGMMYSNIEYINERGKVKGNSVGKTHYPSGRIFKNILREYIIPSPSTIFKKDVFLSLGGYNENLAFEDFDFWVRCSYEYNIQFLPDITVRKRILKNSLSGKFSSRTSDEMLRSTLITYEWAIQKLRNKEEEDYFQQGLSYFFRQCVFLKHKKLTKDYLKLLRKPLDWKTRIAFIYMNFSTF